MGHFSEKLMAMKQLNDVKEWNKELRMTADERLR